MLAEIDSVQVKGIHVEGNKVTKTYIILRELDFKEGSWFPKDKIDAHLAQNRNQIFNSHLFNAVDIHFTPVDSAAIEVFIHVTEKWYIWPYPMIEFADRNFNIWWETKQLSRLNASINVLDYNFRGRAEKLFVRGVWGYSRSLYVNYEIPYLDKTKRHGFQTILSYQSNKEIWHKPVDNRLQFLFDPNKRAYRSVYGEAAYLFRPKIFTRHRIGLGIEDIWVSDTVLLPTENPHYLAGDLDHQFSIYLNYTFKWDRRDIAYYPLKGHFIEVNFSPRILINAKSFYASLQLNAEKFWKFNRFIYAGVGFRGKVSVPQDQPYNLYRALGYKYLVRGFEPFVIDGQHYGLAKSNLKFCLFKRDIRFEFIPLKQFNRAPTSLFFNIYADAGYVYSSRFQSPGNTYQNKLLGGYGAGFDLVTFYDWVIRAEYSINSFGLKGLYLHFTAPI